jgi:hypothetical protein
MKAVEKRLYCGYGECIFESNEVKTPPVVRYVSMDNAISEVCTTNYTLFFHHRYPTTNAAFTVFKNNFVSH